ncbi:MAG TPA: tRNA (adenosine(37)-N6)-threonylcarbamoyltransferase complex ATPase subunit type 1 TsaE [Actinomycetota bacterium]|nr:tRNA (adenosine(37)-N6)-threonylcarbamoyltransferase complex ATPase subunit type 1 TsaE [Actinomycetota bacterium]
MRLPFLAVRTRSSDETTALGEQLGRLLLPGEVLLLTGTLGSGKTTFVQGLAKGLGVEDPCVSPSFTLMRSYEGRYPLLHVDLYRCSGPAEVADLGLEEMLDPPWVAAIEWGEKAGPMVGEDHLEIEFAWDDTGDDSRIIQFRPFGRWRDRMRVVSDSVHDWSRGSA